MEKTVKKEYYIWLKRGEGPSPLKFRNKEDMFETYHKMKDKVRSMEELKTTTTRKVLTTLPVD